MATQKTIITCAVTGASKTTEKNPAVPVTPAEIAQSCIDAAKAGAAIVHIHVRDPETGAPSTSLDLYRETVERIREDEQDVVINLTTGYGQRLQLQDDNIRVPGPKSNLVGAEERVAHIVDLSPEICSLDVATMNSGGEFGDTVMLNSPSQLTRMAKMMDAAGTKPELEVFDIGHVRLATHMVETGLIKSPPFYQLALGVDWGAPANVQTLSYLLGFLPEGAHWAAFGISKESLPTASLSFLCGGHMRVGLEDNLYVRKGELAPSNAALVEQAVQVVDIHDGEVATAADARRILNLKQ